MIASTHMRPSGPSQRIRCPTLRWRCCNAMSTCDFTTPCPLRDWTHQRTRWSHQTRDRASPWRSACMAHDRNAKSRFSGGSAPPTRTLTNQHCKYADSKPLPIPKPLNWSVGVGITMQHNRIPQISAVFYQPKSIWAQFSHLQQFPRDESVVLHSSNSF